MAIWVAILGIIDHARTAGQALGATQLQTRANLPHDRFHETLGELRRRGLVEPATLALTPRGASFLALCREVQAGLHDLGLGDVGPIPGRSVERAG